MTRGKAKKTAVLRAFGNFLWAQDATSRRVGITQTMECVSGLAMVRPSTNTSSKPFVSAAIEHEVSQYFLYDEQPRRSGQRMKGENNTMPPN